VNSLVYGSPFCIIIYTSYKLLEWSDFLFGTPCHLP